MKPISCSLIVILILVFLDTYFHRFQTYQAWETSWEANKVSLASTQMRNSLPISVDVDARSLLKIIKYFHQLIIFAELHSIYMYYNYICYIYAIIWTWPCMHSMRAVDANSYRKIGADGSKTRFISWLDCSIGIMNGRVQIK